MRSYYKLAVLQSDIYDKWNSQLSIIKSYKYAKKVNDVGGQSRSLIMLAIILNDLGDYEKAIEKNEEALRLIEHTRDTLFNRESCINNLGAVYQNTGNHVKAIQYFKKVLENGKIKYEHTPLYATALTNIACSELKLKRIKNIVPKLMEALRLRQNKGEPNDIISSYNNLASYYLAISDTITAKKYSKQALNLSYDSGTVRSLLTSLLQASASDKINSTQYFSIYTKLQDSLQLSERRNRNKFARIAFETD
jgi:two-component system NarL family sensor kinase